MKSAEELLAEIDRRIKSYDSDDITFGDDERVRIGKKSNLLLLESLQSFILSPSAECQDHDALFYRIDSQGHHYKCKKCDKHLFISPIVERMKKLEEALRYYANMTFPGVTTDINNVARKALDNG